MRTKTVITAALFIAGFFASMTTHVAPAQALTCEQLCANAYNACISSGQSKAICQIDRAECLYDCQ